MPVILLCQQCGKEYKRTPFFAQRSRYCSKRCNGLAAVAKKPMTGSGNPNWRGGKLKPCQVCGKEIWVRPSAENTKKYCSRACQLLGRPKDSFRGYLRSPEWRQQASELRRGRPVTQDTRRKISAAHKGIPHSEETLRRIRAAASRRRRRVEKDCVVCSHPFSVIPARAETKVTCCRECWVELQRRLMKERMSNKEFREKALRGLLHRTSPNNPERNLQDILARLYPSEWEYVGDGKVVLDGLIPDFINVNGKKQVIELFGDYWHTKRVRNWRGTELGRIMAFNALGFSCLVVWQHELGDALSLEEKLIKFINGTSRRRGAK